PIYRSQLRNRRRKKGETVTELYEDVYRMLQLAYPGKTTDQGNAVAVDSFLAALDDPALEVRIRDHQPVDLDSAYNKALIFEANSKIQRDNNTSEDLHTRFDGKGKDRQVKGTTTAEENDEAEELPTEGRRETGLA